ncbi:T9SS type A sorting domain-containing protein, partial [bacterium]|nr:T9SS type A sorting domain-containing protein [bacterium]
WKDNVPPNAPLDLTVSPVQDDQIKLEWTEPMPAADGDLPAYYGIYRTIGHPVDVNDPEQLIHITIGPVTEFYDTSADSAASYSYGVVAYDDGDNESTSSGTSVQIADHELLPNSSALLQNYPNPFNARTSIAFQLAGGSLRTSLQVYNILGQKVITLVDDILEPGDHQVTWDGRDERGSPVASGIYLCSLRTGEWQQTKRMMLIR